MTLALLDTDEPSPVRVLRADGRSDFFLTADHAGRRIPRCLGTLGLTDADLDRHITWDIGIAAVTERLSEALDATAVLQVYSRLVIDCNRDPSWLTAIPEISEHTIVPGNLDLTDTERGDRIAAVFTPYHQQITALLDVRGMEGRRTILVAMHSFTPSFKGESRAMEVGILFDRDDRLARIMLDLLRSEGDVTVGENAPYAITANSDYSAPVHGDARGLVHVEVEIRQDEIAEPAGQAAWATRFARLLTNADYQLQAIGL